MALLMPTNITPDVLSGFGGGVFDAASGLEVSWQVNGTPYMTAYRLVICNNDAASTQLYTTGKVALQAPFYGVSPTGEINMFSFTIPASTLAGAGIINGNEYKMYITQWWGSTDEESVTQQSASIIQAISPPSVDINAFDYPITSRSYTFTGNYTQAQGEGLAWVRWVLYNAANGDVVNDTGKIYGTSALQYSYDSLLQGTIYDIELTVETQSGQLAQSGKKTVTVSYPIDMGRNLVTASQDCGGNGISVSWENASSENVTGYAIYRLDSTTGDFVRIVSLPAGQTKLIDYSAKNGHTYTYQLWTEGTGTFLEIPISSNEVTPCQWPVLLIAATLQSDGAYHPQAIYSLNCNVSLGEESNNSKNAYEDTFSGFPAYQKSSNSYRTGRITAFVGKIDPATNAYVGDTADYIDEIMALTTSEHTLFIRDRKGNFRNIQINGSITTQTESAYPNQATTVTIPWVELGEAGGNNVVLVKGDKLWPYDEVTGTTLDIDPDTGLLSWSYQDGYIESGGGSLLSLDAKGNLIQTLDSASVQMADLEIDSREHLIAEQ